MKNQKSKIEYVEKMCSQYAPNEESKLETLRKLDQKVKRPAEIFAYTFGTVGSLVLGTGMCLALKVIGASIPAMFPLGIVIGVVGIGLCGINYFIYKKMIGSGKKKYGDQIVALSDELLSNK